MAKLRRLWGANKILANNRIIIPKGFTFGQWGKGPVAVACSIMWYALGTAYCVAVWGRECEYLLVCECVLERLPVALRIRNLLATHCETILLRYFVAVNNALVYLLSGEAWQREGTEGGSSRRCAQH